MSKMMKRLIKSSPLDTQMMVDPRRNGNTLVCSESTSSTSDSAVEAEPTLETSSPSTFESLRSKQDAWLVSGGLTITHQSLSFQWTRNNMSHCIHEVLSNTHGPIFDNNEWTVDWMCRWLTTLKCLQADTIRNDALRTTDKRTQKGCGIHDCCLQSDVPLLIYIFRRNCLDRAAFLDLSYADWVQFILQLQVDFTSGKVRECMKVCEFCSVSRFGELSARLLKIFTVLARVRDGWLGGTRLGIFTPHHWSEKDFVQTQLRAQSLAAECGGFQGSECDAQAVAVGATVFGRLVVLGHRESRHLPGLGFGNTATPAHFQPIGLSNQSFKLVMRSTPVASAQQRAVVLPRVGGTITNADAAASAVPKKPSMFSRALLSRGLSTLMQPRVPRTSRTEATVQTNYMGRLNRSSNKRGASGEPVISAACKRPSGATAPKTRTNEEAKVDIYQIGRAHDNDFVIRGRLHEKVRQGQFGRGSGSDGGLSGPVSRFAARIECSRSQPHTCRIFAGGSATIATGTNLGIGSSSTTATDRDREVQLGEHAPRWWCPEAMAAAVAVAASGEKGSEDGNLLDGFTTYGLRVYNPEVQEWCEISARGIAYCCRDTVSVTNSAAKGGILLQAPPTARITDKRYSNELVDGSLIDIGGVVILFKIPKSKNHPQCKTDGTSTSVASRESIVCLNKWNPYCPVLFSRLKFVFTSQKSRAHKAMRCQYDGTSRDRRFTDLINPLGCRNYSPDGRHFNLRSFYVPAIDHSTITEESQRPFVFPACGHVFGFHASFSGNPCPLCRHRGPFVPVLFEHSDCLELKISTNTGTTNTETPRTRLSEAFARDSGSICIFNPCGHVANQQLCQQWSSVSMRVMNCRSSSSGKSPEGRSKCPFCSAVLCRAGEEGGPFNKLLFQSDEPSATPAFSPTSVMQWSNRTCRIKAPANETTFTKSVSARMEKRATALTPGYLL